MTFRLSTVEVLSFVIFARVRPRDAWQEAGSARIHWNRSKIIISRRALSFLTFNGFS
jgi:hypothetical protein